MRHHAVNRIKSSSENLMFARNVTRGHSKHLAVQPASTLPTHQRAKNLIEHIEMTRSFSGPKDGLQKIWREKCGLKLRENEDRILLERSSI